MNAMNKQTAAESVIVLHSDDSALQDAIRATNENERARLWLVAHRAFIIDTTTKLAAACGWSRFIPAMIKPWERAPWSYERNGTLVTLIPTTNGWFVEAAAVTPSLVASGEVARLLRNDRGGRTFTMREAARKAVRFMQDNGTKRT